MHNNILDMGQSLNTPRVSINPLIAFVTATERRKKSIVKEQKKPSVFKVAPYATARAAMKKYVKGGFEEECILNALQTYSLAKQVPCGQKMMLLIRLAL